MKTQLCFASIRTGEADSLLQDLRDIMTFSKEFNEKHGISGVLYYADSSFFHCLQGEKETLENLFRLICSDTRHRDIILLDKQEISKSNFKGWTMKYASKDKEIYKFFNKLNLKGFAPEQLDKQTLPLFLDRLYKDGQKKNRQRQGILQRGVCTYF